MANPVRSEASGSAFHATLGRQGADFLFGVDSIRTLRMGLLELAYKGGGREDVATSDRIQGHKAAPSSTTASPDQAWLVLVDSLLTLERIREEWARAAAILRPEVLRALGICVIGGGRFVALPQETDKETQRQLAAEVERQRRQQSKGPRVDYGFVILKLLLQQWIAGAGPVTSDWLGRTAGCSYPTVARALESLGGLIERTSRRRVSLCAAPREVVSRLAVSAGRARSTTRFFSVSPAPASIPMHLQRLEDLAPPAVAIGGVLGARHWFPDLDIAGAPRLDLSLHCPGRQMNFDFIRALDPALKAVTGPQQPAAVAVHAVRHTFSHFTLRAEGLYWADPVECLLDLHEARLDAQAAQFLDHLEVERGSRERSQGESVY